MKVESLKQSTPELFDMSTIRQLDCLEVKQRIRQQPGLIPVAVTADYQVIWLDVGSAPLKEWKFRYAIENLIKEQGLGEPFASPLQCLATEDTGDQFLYREPAGFIFHMSKCGSTLMSRVLEQATSVSVVKEATPLHENVWQYLTNDWQQAVTPSTENLRIIRQLIQLLGRRRQPDQKAGFVRFRSWNIAFAQIIQQAFPRTPSLFIYREPTHVMASISNKPTTGLPRLNDCGAAAYITGCSREELQAMPPLEYFTRFYKHYLQQGLALCHSHNTRCINYRHLNKHNLSHILRSAWQFEPETDELQLMQAQFDVYSKDDSGTVRFTSDNQEKQKQVTPEMQELTDTHLRELYRQLELHPRNLNRTLAQALPDSETGRVKAGSRRLLNKRRLT